MVGLFINTLPLRAAVEDDVPALAWLQRLQERQVEQRQYEYSPLADVQRWSGVEPGRALFESLLVFENYPVDPALRESGLALGVRGLGTRETTNYPLTLVAAAAGTRLVVRLLYDPRRFGEHAIAGLPRHLARVLEGLSGAADGRRLGELGLLDAGERSALLREAASTEAPYPRDATIAEAFRAQVARDPDAVAASCDGQVLRYGELDQRSNRLARRLRALGVRADARVGVCLRRSLDLPVALLGTLKAGAAYVPLDAAYPAERLAFMLADAGVSVLLTEERLAASLPRGTHAVVRLDADGGAIAAESAEPFASGATPDTLAYVTYTSGSTGRPKGVEVRHRGVLRLLFGVDYVRLGPDQTLLQLAPVSFDASTLEIWGALLHGGRCALFPGERPTARDLGRAIAAEGVTTLWLTASLFNAVVDEAPEVLAPVRQLLIGGEALSVEHVRRALACLPGTRIVNGYGPTESTTFTCCHEIPRPLGEGVRAIPIGRAIGNTRTYVLDRGLRLVPAGVAGELFIGGDGLARGYLGRPALTAERFVPDPFAARPGERLYRTGDRVRRGPDGTLEFLGRFDHQVKVRGFRIELGEIESALRRHPLVADAVVVVREDRPRDHRVVGYVARRDGAALGPQDLRAELQARLPEYMVPSAFVVLDRLPLGAAGKVDRRALPAPEASLAPEPFAPPRDELESAIAAAWREVLGVEEVGIHDSFFDLGGHSLSLLKVHGRLVDVARPHELTIVELFEHPTVASLAAHLRGAGEGARRGTAEDRAKRLEEGRSRLGRRLQMLQNAGRPGRPAGAEPDPVQPAPAEVEER
jgi:amino acid adenylation domain-containing protein